MASEGSLERRRRTLAARLPDVAEVLRGSVVERRMRCGKLSCRCQSDPAARHGPYRHLVTTTGRGRTRSVLIDASQLRWVRAAVGRYRLIQELLEALSEVNAELLGLRQRKARGRRGRLR